MTNSKEEENVSLDEMMERLKRSQKSSTRKESVGQLVTREDGSKMLKVKRRKRRTEQPVYEERKKKKLVKLTLFISIFSFCCLLIGLIAFLYIHFNSLAFTDDLRAQIKNSSGAETDFVNLAVTPLFATADAVDFTWGKSSILKSGKIIQTKAKLDTVKLFSGKLGSSEISAAKGSFELQLPSGEMDFSPASGPSVKVLDIPRLRLRYGSLSASGNAARRFFIKDAEMGIDPKGDTLFVWTKKGTLNFGDLGSWDMQRAAFTIDRKNSLTVEYLEAHQEETEAKIFIEKSDVLVSSSAVRLKARAEKMPLKLVFGDLFSEIVGGNVNIDELIVDLKKESAGKIDLKGKFSSGEIKLGRLPLFVSVRRILRTSPKSDSLLSPLFTKSVVGEFEVQGQDKKIVFSDLNRPGQFALRGTLKSFSGGQLSGNLSIGIPIRFIEQLVESSVQDAFSRESKGYRWIDVEVGGSVKDPDDDLYDRLTRSSDSPKSSNHFVNPEAAGDSAQDLEKVFDELTN